ncbi:MAG: hypothetical protein R3D46_04535 [Defluviimonas denitrificans]
MAGFDMGPPFRHGGGMQPILFVCLGNICRSPAAEAVFQRPRQRGRSGRGGRQCRDRKLASGRGAPLRHGGRGKAARL